VIARDAALLERRLVLFVDHDHAEVDDRSKERGARANHDLDLSGGDAEPSIKALRICHLAVQDGDISEARTEPPNSLWSERDLGHEDDRTSSGFDSGLDRT
jgi:hypothetical protein